MPEKTPNTISAAEVKVLRDMTGEPLMRCKKALIACDGHVEDAIKHLRKQGLTQAIKKSDREAKEAQSCALRLLGPLR